MNPYDFVPYPSAVRREGAAGHDAFEGLSGVLKCELEALSPLLVMDSQQRAGGYGIGRFMQDADGAYIIPGTSLKGLIRSTFEVLLPSCVNTYDQRKSRRLVSKDVQSCRDRSHLCPACRTFGFLNGGSIHHGLINIGQARLHGEARTLSTTQLIPLFGAHSEIDAIYCPDGEPAGRKFYFHHHTLNTATTENDIKYGPRIEPVEGRRGDRPGATFQFTVTFENFAERELQGLVAALTLSDRAPLDGDAVKVRHKFGYGKPAGLGSAEIRIREASLSANARERYRSFSAKPPSMLDGSDALRQFVEGAQSAFFRRPSAEVKELIRILRYPPPEGAIYRYPIY